MILVSVGSDPFPFERLMGWLDLFLRQDLIREEVVVHTGPSSVIPSGARVFRDLPEPTFLSLAARARAVVTDCGEANLRLLEDLDVPFLLVPRSARFGEQVDDHQLELALALQSFAVPIGWGPGDLLRFLDHPRRAAISDLSASMARCLCAALERRFSVPAVAGSGFGR